MNESFAKNDSFIMRNLTVKKESNEEKYKKYDIPVIPHSKIKILATDANIQNWIEYSKHVPKMTPLTHSSRRAKPKKDPYLINK